jgi:DNA polymerase-3 subunit gamma/tau
VNAILKQDSASGLNTIHSTLDGGSDPRQFARQIVDYLRNLILVRLGNARQVDATREIQVQMAEHAQAFTVRHLLKLIRAFNQAGNDSRITWQPALPLELAFIESLEIIIEEPPQPGQAEQEPPKTGSPVSPKGGETDQKVPQLVDPQPKPGDERVIEAVPNKIQHQWREILAQVRQENPQTQALLNSCKPLGVKNGALVLGFNGEFARSKMEQADNLKILKQVMERVIGECIPVRCVISAGGKLPSDIDQDGMVATALRDLGGEIVDIQ